MENKDTFSGYNPIINFVFFIGAVVFGMFFVHPVFMMCSLLLASVYYITVKKSASWKFLIAMLPLFVVLSLVSPLFNTNGSIVLFTYLGGRPYTLESLYYGMVLAVMFISVIIWFASYNIVMTTDKFLYIFGKAAPSISLVLSMIMRLVPGFQKKIGQISSARKCIGKAGDSGTRREKAENSMTVISTLTSWALEGGIITADSMRSRGYGSGKRTNFAIYRFDGRDVILLLAMCLLIAVILLCGIMGGMKYTAGEAVTMDNIYTRIGIAAYIIFLSLPPCTGFLSSTSHTSTSIYIT